MHKVLSNILLAAALTATVLCLNACGKSHSASATDYIGIDAAKETALTAAKLSSDKVPYLSASLDSKNNMYYYQVTFTENDIEHSYEIDALTGTIIGESHTPAPQAETSADSLAVNETPAIQGNATPSQPETETSPAEDVSGQIPASTPGSVKQPETLAETQPAAAQLSTQPPAQTASGKIDETAALAAALAHAGIDEQNLTFKKVKADIDNGIQIFEVEFITLDGIEYDYDVSAEDGSIIRYDFDAESLLPSSPAPGSSTISADQAKQAVLALVPGAAAENIVLHLDNDDRHPEYEGSLIHDSIEYEFKIDAYSGSIIEWEAEPFHSHR